MIAVPRLILFDSLLFNVVVMHHVGSETLYAMQ
jgi:hypothetical protein